MATDTSALSIAPSGASMYGRSMYFGVLGTIEATDEKRKLSLGGPKQRTVLALLIARAGTTVSTDALVDGVYGDEAPQGARRSVQTYVSNLRGELGDAIEATGSGYVLRAERSGVDALLFEDAISEANKMNDPERASQILGDALALWRGHPYAEIDGLFQLTAERARLTELRMSAIEARVDADLERGHHRQLIAELDSLTEEHPFRERFRAQQMLALYRSGRQAEALRAYEKTRTYLVDEMGLDPSQDLRELEQRILDQDPSLRFETGPTVKHLSILVADVADPRVLSDLDPNDRYDIITHQSDAISEAIEDQRGDLFAHRGSAIYVSFEDVEHSVRAAIAAQQALAEVGHGMRMAISAGELQIPQDAPVQGPPVTRAARLTALAHGGQVLLSSEANRALAESGVSGWGVRSLGQHDIDGSGEARPVYQLLIDGTEHSYPPLRTEQLPVPPPITTQGLPGYELREQVGTGAFGVVHRAFQPSVGREVAIKIVKSEYANDPTFIRRFEVEAQLVARLEHPHIVPLHDYWRNPDGAYLVMRWLGGGTLKDKIAARHLSIDEAHSLLADIGPALAFAHRRGVVHRDIKLSNVMMDEEGGAYLTDFGIAKDIALDGAGNAAKDIQALAALLRQCLGDLTEKPVAALLTSAAEEGQFSDVQSFAAAWEEVAGAGQPTSRVVGYTPTRNPYKGLSAFGELDAPDFHGRDAEIQEIIDVLAHQPMVAVVGPSGIGKSSVVRAGMIPALRSGAIPGSAEWLITDMLPGAYPYEELSSALMRVATQMPNDLEEDLRRDERGLVRSVKRYVPHGQTVLLIVDQFEELFTMSSEDDSAAFLAMLSATVNDERSKIRIVITMRADFFDRPLRFADFGASLRAGTIPISAPSDESLHIIVAAPAAGVRVAFEAGLVDHIVAEVRHQPGILPLLEFSLTELFDERDSDLLTLDAYKASGGVLGGLARRAEATYVGLDARGQDAAREIFLRLVNVSEDGRDTRRRVRLTEIGRLGFTDLVLRTVLDSFGQHRLITFDRDAITRSPTIEVAHEAILSEWPRLAAWIDEHREDLLLRSRLASAVADWVEADRADSHLLTQGRLDQHETWTAHTGLRLTGPESEFLESSRSSEDAQRAKRRRTRRLIVSGFGIAALVAAVLAAAALVSRTDAQEQAAAADDARQLSLSRELALQSDRQVEFDPERSMLLAIKAIEVGRDAGDQVPEATAALHRAVQSQRITARYPGGGFVAVSPDGTFAATADLDGGVVVYDLSSGSVVDVLNREAAVPVGANFSRDGGSLSVVYAGAASPVWIWNLRTRSHLALSGDAIPADSGPPYRVDVSADGNMVAVPLNGATRVWNLATGASIDIAAFGDVEFSPVGSALIVADYDAGVVRIFDPMTGLETGDLAVGDFSPQNIAVDPDGERLAIISAFDRVFAVYDIDRGEELIRATIDRPNGQLAWFPDGDRVLVGGDAGVARVFDASTGDVVAELIGHQGLVWATATTPDDSVAVTASQIDGSMIVWNAEAGSLPEVGKLGTGVERLRSFAYVGGGDSIFVTGRGDPATAMVIDGDDASPRLVIDNQLLEPGREPRPVGDGTVAATVGVDGSSSVVSLTTGEALYVAPEGLFVNAMTVDGDRVLVAAKAFAEDPGEPRTEIISITTGGSVRLADDPAVAVSRFSPDGSLVWVWEGIDFEFYDTTTGKEAFRLPVFNVLFMPDGEELAVIDEEGVLYVADIGGLMEGGTLEEVSRWTRKAHDSFTPLLVSNDDGSLIMTGEFRAPAKVWDATDGSLVAEFESGLTSTSPRGAFHPTRPEVTLMGDSGTLLTFTLDTDQLIDIARSRLTRDLSEAECQAYLHVDSCTDF